MGSRTTIRSTLARPMATGLHLVEDAHQWKPAGLAIRQYFCRKTSEVLDLPALHLADFATHYEGLAGSGAHAASFSLETTPKKRGVGTIYSSYVKDYLLCHIGCTWSQTHHRHFPQCPLFFHYHSSTCCYMSGTTASNWIRLLRLCSSSFSKKLLYCLL